MFLLLCKTTSCNLTGHHQTRIANETAKAALKDAKKQTALFEAETTKINADKKEQQQRINRKSVDSARASLRRPGFLESGVEGTSDVLG